MKSKTDKRLEALERARNAKYENSKAKRKGIPEARWQEDRDIHIAALKEELRKEGLL